jgi:uncharacterized protein (DUF342 family)
MDNAARPNSARSDGKLSLRPTADMSALYMSYTLPSGGGAAISPEAVINIAKSHGVVVELDVAAITKTLQEGGSNVCVAHGRASVPGEDGRIELLFDKTRKRSPHLDEHGLADFRDLGEIVTVKAGQPLMRLIPPGAGVPGMTVTGKEIPAQPGRKLSFPPKIEGAIPDPQDPNRLVAAITGFPILTKDGGVKVEAVYRVDNVDLHTGNISFDGGVHVAGDVHSGMTVKASGDIVIEGTAEAAMLDAGGDITIKGGIVSSDEDTDAAGARTHAVIKCGGSCVAKFAQGAHIAAGNGIFIHGAAVQCDLTAAHQIIAGEQGGRGGDLIGGIARATMLVKAQNIGSEDHPRTIVIVGNDKNLFEQLRVCNERKRAADNKFADVLMALGAARKNPAKSTPEALAELDAARVAALAEIAECTAESLQLKKEIELAQAAQVVAERRVFFGAEIRVGQKHCEPDLDREGGVFRLENGDLVFK